MLHYKLEVLFRSNATGERESRTIVFDLHDLNAGGSANISAGTLTSVENGNATSLAEMLYYILADREFYPLELTRAQIEEWGIVDVRLREIMC